MQKWLFNRRLWVMLVVLGLGAGPAFAMEAPSYEFVQDYYGNGDSNYIHVLGTELATPELTLSGGTLGMDWEELGNYQAEYGGGVCGVLFEYVSESGDTEANITLKNGAKIALTYDAGDAGFLLAGVATSRFAESHVNLSGNSSIYVDAQGTRWADSIGVALSYTSAPLTAAVTLDDGSTITAKATAIDDSGHPDASAQGVALTDDEHAMVTLDNGSAISAEASAHYTGTDSSSADASAYGVYADDTPLVEIELNGSSSVSAVATAESDVVDGYNGATATGIYAYGETTTVDLAEGSTVSAQATGSEAASYGIDVGYSGDEVDHGEVNLTGASSVSSVARATDSEGYAESIGVAISARYIDTAILNLQNHSTINATATGAHALTAGGLIEHSPHGVVDITTGSSITATANAVSDNATGDVADAVASSIGLDMYDVDEVGITLDQAQLTSTMTATATQTGIGEDSNDATAFIGENGTPGGIVVENYTRANIDLTDAVVSVTAATTASSSAGLSFAGSDFGFESSFVTGLSVQDGDETEITLLRSDIDVDVQATAGNRADALAGGIFLRETRNNTTLSLIDSNVSVVTTATATAAGGDSMTEALGIYAAGGNGQISLDNTIVSAEALSSTVDGMGAAAGAVLVEGEYTLELTNHSQISATQTAGMAWFYGGSIAVFAGGADVAIAIDSTSSLHGYWAVFGGGSDVSVDNAGMIAGRLLVNELNNRADGVLQASFGSDDIAGQGDGINFFSGEDFYFTVGSATLGDGTTFHIVPTDNLGLSEFGDAQTYALLEAGEGVWAQTNLNLTAPSPLLGLSWAEESEEPGQLSPGLLFVTATFLTPEQAGLSDNATAAFSAAMEDDVFTFASDPEKWVPNISGAFLSGMTQSLSTSYASIGNRLGALMGMNSGDEIVASNGMWYSVRHTDADQSRRDGIDGFDADTTALSFGYDRDLGNAIVGIAYTHGSTDADADDNSATLDMDDNLISLYGSYDGGNWYGEAILSTGFGSVDSVRYNGNQAYTADYDSDSYNAKVEVGMKIKTGGMQVNPAFAMEYSSKDYESYTESGDSLALQVHSQDYEILKMGAGATASKELQRSWGMITPEVSAMLNYDVINDRVVSTANFVGGSTSFVARGIEPAETSWDLGAAVTIAGFGEQNVSFRLSYDYSGRADFDAHSFTGKLRFEF